jgi:hypothetical protein
MNSPIRNLLAVSVMALSLGAAPLALAKDKPLPAATTMTTVYVEAHGGKAITKDVNALHARMEAEGWKFASLVLHTENGDTKGVWVTYTK